MVKLGEMKQLLDACGSLSEVHLVLSAATKTSDIKEILRQFEPFNYRAVIVTKLDETIRTGNVISALADAGKSISYVTNGQKVPTDIRRASVVQFLINLEGFQVNRAGIEEKFPENSFQQIQKWG
jgi:flagellar biosynthesis protein FlhF